MAVTVTTKQGYGSRIGGAFKGILSGIIAIVIGIVLLWWNEGRTVKRAKALNEGGKAVIPVQSDIVDAANDGKLIHTTGKTEVFADLVDSDFGITIPKGIQLERIVEMYQWVEESESKQEKKLGGSVETTTVYTYSKAWMKSIVDSSSFKEEGHDNPVVNPVPEKNIYASSVALGAFQLTASQIQSIGQKRDYLVPQDIKL
ncbi:MAG: TMEM43 family protein, partial [Lentisphaeria bacterium]|nr:TMEM43 family protein [Lentisphaeria bacterium]